MEGLLDKKKEGGAEDSKRGKRLTPICRFLHVLPKPEE